MVNIDIFMKNKEYFSTTELAKILGVSQVTVFKRIKNGEIKAIKIGRNFAIPKEEIESALDKTLTKEQKNIIEKAVKKTVKDYGKALELLSQE